MVSRREIGLVGAFNQEKALVGAFSVIVKTGCGTDGALHITNLDTGVESECKWRMETIWPDHESRANVLIVDCHTMTDLCLQCHTWHVTRDGVTRARA